MMDGQESSLSLQGEGYSRPQSALKRSYKYKVISHTSAVDETLFGSHRDKRTVKDTSKADYGQNNLETGSRKASPKIREPLTSSSYHSRKDFRGSQRGRVSYVDETLFGRKLDSPTFDPPWAEKKDPRFKDPPLSWSPPVSGSLSDTPKSRPSTAQSNLRPSSRLSQRSSSALGTVNCGVNRSHSKPPWR